MEMRSEIEIRRETEIGGDGDSRGKLEIEKYRNVFLCTIYL